MSRDAPCSVPPPLLLSFTEAASATGAWSALRGGGSSLFVLAINIIRPLSRERPSAAAGFLFAWTALKQKGEEIGALVAPEKTLAIGAHAPLR